MRRAGQTPHGARPNREEVPPWRPVLDIRQEPAATAGRVPARRAIPPGRSLEPRSNARPRGMTVPPQGGQNSAYRSGCHIISTIQVLRSPQHFRCSQLPQSFARCNEIKFHLGLTLASQFRHICSVDFLLYRTLDSKRFRCELQNIPHKGVVTNVRFRSRVHKL